MRTNDGDTKEGAGLEERRVELEDLDGNERELMR